jgi:branched-chain amino acid transport system substrate-binding protein
MRYVIALAVSSVLAAGFGTAKAENGVSSNAILFGQAAVLQGPASALGLGMKAGLLAAFAEANRKGGVHGRQIKLISLRVAAMALEGSYPSSMTGMSLPRPSQPLAS